jgi:2'-5' RNA ligase
MRAFFGIPLDDKLRAALKDVQLDLRGAGADVTWPEPESLHMTMKFLGQVDDGVRFHLPPMRALDLELAGIGEFAGRIVWAGCRGDLDGLRACARRLEEAAERVGVPREKRPFEPHVTIGRIRSTRNLGGLRKAMDRWKEKVFGPWRVRRVILFRSETSPRGSVYRVVAEYPCIDS